MQSKRKLQIVSVEIGGKNYKLAYDFNEIVKAEKESGVNLLHGLVDLAAMSAAQLTGLLCAAMRAADPKSNITVAQVSQLLQYESIFPFSDALAKSILLSLPKKAKVEPPADEPPVEDDPIPDNKDAEIL